MGGLHVEVLGSRSFGRRSSYIVRKKSGLPLSCSQAATFRQFSQRWEIVSVSKDISKCFKIIYIAIYSLKITTPISLIKPEQLDYSGIGFGGATSETQYHSVCVSRGRYKIHPCDSVVIYFLRVVLS